MKQSRFSEEEKIRVLKEAEGKPVKTVCARHNISEATYYHWKNKFGGMEVRGGAKTAGIGRGERAA